MGSVREVCRWIINKPLKQFSRFGFCHFSGDKIQSFTQIFNRRELRRSKPVLVKSQPYLSFPQFIERPLVLVESVASHMAVFLNHLLMIVGLQGFPDGSHIEESTCNVGDLRWIPRLGISPRGGHGNPLQYFCLENPMGRGAWWATVHGVARSPTD